MRIVWGDEEIKNTLKDLKKRREKIIKDSSVKVYNIIRKLIKEVSADDALHVTALAGSTRYYNPDIFNGQLQHVCNTLEFSEKDKVVLREHLEKAEKEKLKRKEEEREFEKNRKKGTFKLPSIGIN